MTVSDALDRRTRRRSARWKTPDADAAEHAL